jgi:hypothetical protein
LASVLLNRKSPVELDVVVGSEGAERGAGNQERTTAWEALPGQKLATRRGRLQVRTDERERQGLNIQEDADDGGNGKLDGHEWRTSMTVTMRGCSTCSTRRLTKLSKLQKLRRFREERASGDEGSGGREEGRSSRVADRQQWFDLKEELDAWEPSHRRPWRRGCTDLLPYEEDIDRWRDGPGGPKTRRMWRTAGIRLGFFLPSFDFLLPFLAEIILGKEKIRRACKKGVGKILKQVQTIF